MEALGKDTSVQKRPPMKKEDWIHVRKIFALGVNTCERSKEGFFSETGILEIVVLHERAFENINLYYKYASFRFIKMRVQRRYPAIMNYLCH